MIGSIISHYRILEKIGSGGMGEIFLAEDTKLERKVALKFLPRHLTEDKEANLRFEREAKAAAALNHPNIVTVYEIGEHDGQVFIAMEYVEGQTLKELISVHRTPSTVNRSPITHHPLPITQVIDIATQIASGLAAAHAKGIVHRDIKPQNILVDKDNRVKILDFGLAKLKGVSSLTKESSTLGTVHYMSPEQTMGKEVDHKTDIWSLGVIFYEMLTGKLPYKGDYEQAVIYSILNEEPEPAQKHRADLSPEFLHILSRALEKMPDERYQGAGDMLIDLNRLKRDTDRVHPFSAKGTPAAGRAGATGGKKKPYWIGMSAAIVLAAVALGYFGQKLFRVGPGAPEFRKNSIAVMYFEDRSGEENFGRILAEMLISNLSRCKQIEVVSSQHLFDILKRMKVGDPGTISRSMATDVARKARVQAMLVGSIDRIGATFNVNAQLCDVGTGSVIGPAQAKGPRVEDVYEMVNRLTDDTIRLMGVTLPGESRSLRINDVTTHSFEAYRHYQKGMEQIRRFDFSGAAKEFQAAIEIDGTFAMAHVNLAFSKCQFKFGDPFSDLSLERESMRLARQYAAGISDQERDCIDLYEAMAHREYGSMIAILKELTRKYPDNKVFLVWLGIMHSHQGNYERSVQAMKKLIAIDPEQVYGHLILAYAYSRSGEHEKAIATIKNYIALLPDVANSYDSACDIYLKAGMYDEAYRVCDQALKANPGWRWPIKKQSYIHLLRNEGDQAREKNRLLMEISPAAAQWSLIDDLGCFDLYEGRYRQAESDFKKAIQAVQEQKNADGEMDERLVLGRFYGGQGKFSNASEQFSEVKKISIESLGNSYNTWPVRADYYWGVAALGVDRIDECRAAAQRIREYIEKNKCDGILMNLHRLLLAEIDMKSGQAAKASIRIDKLSLFTRRFFPRCRLLAADALAMQGEAEKAKRAYEALLDDHEITFSGQGGDFFDYWQIRSALKYRMARSCEKSGARTQAAAYYQQALDQWKNADEDVPEFIDAKARLARLKMDR